jgi:hypothetical protein
METHAVEKNGAIAILKMSSKIMYVEVMLVLQYTREILTMAQQIGTRLLKLQVHTRYYQGLSNYMEQQIFCYELSHTFYFLLYNSFLFPHFFFLFLTIFSSFLLLMRPQDTKHQKTKSSMSSKNMLVSYRKGSYTMLSKGYSYCFQRYA